MKKAFAVLALLAFSLTGCGRNESSATAEQATLQPPAAEAPEAPAAAPTTEALEQAAAATQEKAAAEEPAAAEGRLERMAALPESAQLPAGKWRVGTHYLPVSPAQPTSAEPGQVEVMEVFWYGCPHCYALEPTIQGWEKAKASYVKFVRLPVMWGAVHRAHARLFYTLQALGKAEELHTTVFDEIHKRGNFLVANDEAQTLRLQVAFAREHGISEGDYTRAYNSPEVKAALEKAEDLTRRYRVDGVPVLFVNGKYQTGLDMTGSPNSLVSLLNDLAAAEKRR